MGTSRIIFCDTSGRESHSESMHAKSKSWLVVPVPAPFSRFTSIHIIRDDTEGSTAILYMYSVYTANRCATDDDDDVDPVVVGELLSAFFFFQAVGIDRTLAYRVLHCDLLLYLVTIGIY